MKKNTKKWSENLLDEWETSNVLQFSVKASNEKVTLKTITTTITAATAATDLDSITKISLFKSWSKSALVTVDNDDFTIAWKVATVEFAINQAINADSTEYYEVKATLDDGTITSLWRDFTFTLADISYRTASDSTVVDASAGDYTTPIAIVYTMASTQPTFELVKNANEISATITNESKYDLANGIEFELKLIWVFVDGADLLQAALDASSFPVVVKDDNDNEIVWSSVAYAANKLTVTLPATYTIDSNSSDTFVIELPELTQIESNYYNVSEKSMTFQYDDGVDHSHDLTAAY